MSHNITLRLPNEAATLNLGSRLAQSLQAGTTVYLYGDLGAGKTTLVRGLLHAAGHQGKVKSPTYTLVEPYEIANKMFYHFDLYRFNDEEEWEAAGFRDHFNQNTICLVEWPEKAGNLIPYADVEIHLAPDAEGRVVNLKSNTEIGTECLKRLSAYY